MQASATLLSGDLGKCWGDRRIDKRRGTIVDVVFIAFYLAWLFRPRSITRGMGCTLGAAITCELAMGSSSKLLFREFVF